MKWAVPLLVGAYPVLTHAAVHLSAPLLHWVALVCLLTATLWPRLARRSGLAWLLLLAGGAGLYAVVTRGGSLVALVLPSIAIPALLTWVFGSTLLPGRQPLIARFASVYHPQGLSLERQRYTRLLTQLWTGLFVLLIVDSLLLVWLDQMYLWSLMTNFGHYLLVGLLFVLEFLYRRWRFPSKNDPGFFQNIRDVAVNGLRD